MLPHKGYIMMLKSGSAESHLIISNKGSIILSAYYIYMLNNCDEMFTNESNGTTIHSRITFSI